MRKLKSLLGIIGVVTIVSLSGCGGGGGSTSSGSSNDLDNLGPILISSFPFANAPSILPSTNIIMKFNKTIVKGDGYIKIYNQNDSNQMMEVNIDSEEVILNEDEVIIHLQNGHKLDSNTTYYINVDGGAIKDSSGKSFEGINDNTTLNFTTVNIVSEFNEVSLLLQGGGFGFENDNEKWGNGSGTGVNLSYSFATSTDINQTSLVDDDVHATFSGVLNDEQKNSFRLALKAWENVANVTFTEVSDVGPNTGGLIRAVFYHDGNDVGSGAAHAYGDMPNEDGGATISLNDHYKDTYFKISDFNPLGGRATMIHELGHILGFTHPNGDANDEDYTKSNTIMSYNAAKHSYVYFDTDDDNWYYRIYDETPMMEDIKDMQILYGANMSYKNGDDTYTFDQNRPFFKTIWDAGGNDTISTANFSKNCVINLNEGNFSSIRMDIENLYIDYCKNHDSCYDGTNNLGLAYGVTIENAIGGSGDDRIIGNSINNNLTGGLGKDTFVFNGIFGSDTITDFVVGSDILELNSSMNGKPITKSGNTITIEGYGTITLSGIDVATLDSSLLYKFVP